MKTITGKLSAWISQDSLIGPKDIASGEWVDGLSFFRLEADMTKYGYTRVGEADIVVDLVDEKTLIDNKVAALRTEAANIRAEAMARCTRIEGQIQQLLAIEFQPS